MTETKTPKAKDSSVLTIHNVNHIVRNTFRKLSISHNLTQPLFLATMIKAYQNLHLEFDDSERAIMQEARELTPKTFDKRIRKLVLRYAKTIINQKDQPPRPVDIKLKNSSAAANARADALIEKIFKHNNEAANRYDKIFLSKSSIFDYSEKQKAQDPTNITIGQVVLDRALERNKERIDKHHREHKLADNHNITAYYERLKAEKEEAKS